MYIHTYIHIHCGMDAYVLGPLLGRGVTGEVFRATVQVRMGTS
jgi:hypothetical protein